MKKVVTYVKQNPAVVVLGILAIALLIVLFTRQNQKTVVQPVLPVPELILTQPGQAAATPLNTYLFCLQIDHREDGHLPDMMGAFAQNAYPNGVSGRNWALPPNSTGAEPYGVLPDGTIFAKESFLKEWGMVSHVAIKADFTGWQPITLILSQINGETAYVYKK